MVGGQVVGKSDRLGAYAVSKTFGPADLAATVYHALGVDPATELHDRLGRPRRLCSGEVMTSLHTTAAVWEMPRGAVTAAPGTSAARLTSRTLVVSRLKLARDRLGPPIYLVERRTFSNRGISGPAPYLLGRERNGQGCIDLHGFACRFDAGPARGGHAH